MKKGQEREKSLTKNDYFSEGYFATEQLLTYVEQVQNIQKCLESIKHDKSNIKILEIGKGNGFISSFFKNMGYNITTFDINESLNPDVVGDILELTKYFKLNSFDLVICCEVLEHLPFEYFEKSLNEIDKINKNMLFLTIPEFKSFSGFNLFIKYFNKNKFLSFHIGTKAKHKLTEQHFWELDSSDLSSKINIVNILDKKYILEEFGRFKLNPYHNFFVLLKNI